MTPYFEQALTALKQAAEMQQQTHAFLVLAAEGTTRAVEAASEATAALTQSAEFNQQAGQALVTAIEAGIHANREHDDRGETIAIMQQELLTTQQQLGTVERQVEALREEVGALMRRLEGDGR